MSRTMWTLLFIVCMLGSTGCQDERDRLLKEQQSLIVRRNHLQEMLRSNTLSDSYRADLEKSVRNTQAEIDRLNWEILQN